MKPILVKFAVGWLLAPGVILAQPAEPVAPQAEPDPGAAAPENPAPSESPVAADTSPPATSDTPALPGEAQPSQAPNPPVVLGTPEDSAATDDAGQPKKKKKKGKDEERKRAENLLGGDGRYGRLELGGRVFTRAAFSQREVGTSNTEWLDLSVSSARIDVSYEAPVKWLSLDIELDVAGKPEMKDAYIQAKGEHFFGRAGQFKPPISIIEMESPWDLPMAGRGFLHDLLVDYLDVAGRRPGVLVGYRGRGGIKPRLSVGAFQGSVLRNQSTEPGDRDVDLIEEQSLEAQGLAARFDVDLGSVKVGAFYQHRVGSPYYPETKHYPTGGVDLLWDQTFDTGGVRVWADLIGGTSWYEYEDKPVDDDDAVFLSGRVIAAYRFGGTEDEAFYVEPFALAGALEPDTEVDSDWAIEGVLGVNVGLWRRARVTIQGEINQGDAKFPNQTNGYLFGLSPDRKGITVQAGMAF